MRRLDPRRPAARSRIGALVLVSATLALAPGVPGVFVAEAATAATSTTAAPTTTVALTTVPPLAAIGKPAAETLVAAATVRKVSVFATPNAAKPVSVLDNRKNYSGRTVFIVVGHQPGWYQVLVPSRPNGRTGWVKASEIGLFRTTFSIAISLSKRELVVYDAGKEIMRETVAIGQAKYPTPTGVFFISEGVRPANPRGAYGTFAFGLSGYSTVLTRFGRGDGQIGIHGTNQPTKLGQNVSHGCIRMRNEAVTKLSKLLPQGVPVVIEA
jgi:lipoprotein-anchoring transpeptidase ErfK/SrfK